MRRCCQPGPEPTISRRHGATAEAPIIFIVIRFFESIRIKSVAIVPPPRHQAAGFPDIASTRYALTEPALIGQPPGASGYAIARVDPVGRVIVDPQVPHSSYDTQLGKPG